MANTNSPFGFQPVDRLPGAAPNAAQAKRKISSSYSTAIYSGDPVTSVASGYIENPASGTAQIAGVFVGCEYLNTAQNKKVWSSYWPGSGATGDVTAYIINDPATIFKVQSNNTAIGFADIDANIAYLIGTGNALSGVSGATVDQSTIATTNTLPFRIVGLYNDGNPALPGADSTAAYNIILVTFNNQDFKSLTGVAA